MKFGDRVDISHKLIKVNTHTQRIWRSVEFKREDCIFLGIRVLREGVVHYADDQAWFEAKQFKKAALVAVNHLLNPIYVPLDSVEMKW